MLLTRIHLRNYRVYEDPLDLALPPGLIGIYGPNGSGKSTLLESILFALWGKARTGKEDVRTAGVGGECLAEIGFEHEGHHYLVRRTLAGINLTAKAEVHCDGLAMAEGVRDAGRYLHQVLGMDDAAFRASVFAEQKQLAAFSNRTPAERRQLVLQLLGITPIDSAREAARKDARDARQRHDRLRELLPDLEALRTAAEDAAAAAAAAAVTAATEEAVAAAARAAVDGAEAAFGRADRLRQAYDALVIEGRGVKSQLEEAQGHLARLESEDEALRRAAAELEAVRPKAEGLSGLEARLGLVASALAAERSVGALAALPEEPPAPDRDRVEASEQAADRARADAAGLAGQLAGVQAEVIRALDHAARSDQLSGEEDCPLCGQALGAAFERVRAHRADEVSQAKARQADLAAAHAAAARRAGEATAALAAVRKEADRLRAAREAWEQARARRVAAEEALAEARAALMDPDRMVEGSLEPCHHQLRADVDARREAAATVDRLLGRLERRQAVTDALAQARVRVAELEHERQVLLDKLRSLEFDPAALDEAGTALVAAREAAAVAARVAGDARLLAERAAVHADGEARRLADGERQHTALVDLAESSRHLGRVADLLTSFRNTVVGAVGPRLAAQAAELFGELTDHEYDQLRVDPESYQLMISDGGRVFELERFSGSEVDLANLALRVAISEHVRFQSGGTVGLLVLDEVFGPLDEERKVRMLQALERLRGRFRQILVVTHDADIKEQLPYAVEVQKLAGRRARAQLLNA